jgi:hypothetical protein
MGSRHTVMDSQDTGPTCLLQGKDIVRKSTACFCKLTGIPQAILNSKGLYKKQWTSNNPSNDNSHISHNDKIRQTNFLWTELTLNSPD